MNGLDLFNYDARPSGHFKRPSLVGFCHSCLSSAKSGCVVKLRISSIADLNRVVLDIWPFIPDKESGFFQNLLSCKSQRSSQTRTWMSQLCSIHEVKKLHQSRDCSNEGLNGISDRSYQVEESRFSQVFHNASLRICFKESIRHVFSVTLHTPGAYGR